MKKHCCFYLFLILCCIKLTPLRAQDSIKFTNQTDYLNELFVHTSPNDGADLHFIGWILNTSKLTFNKRHSLNLGLMITHGGEPSANIVGDLQTFSNLEAGFLYGANEIYYQYENEDFWLKLGQQDVNTDFFVTSNGMFYTHSSFGIDPVSAINMPAPTYPVTGFSLTSGFRLNSSLSLKLGVFDGQFGIPKNDYLRKDWSLKKDEGLLYLIEPEIKLLQGKWVQKVGFYHHSGLFDRKDNGGRSRGLSAFYLVADIQLKKWENRSLDLFYQFTTSTSVVSDLDYYFGIGLKMTNPFGKDSEDEIGIALGHASINTQFTSVRDAYNISGESAIELSYKTKVNDWLSLQPYIHYIGMNDIGEQQQNPIVFALRGLFSF